MRRQERNASHCEWQSWLDCVRFCNAATRTTCVNAEIYSESDFLVVSLINRRTAGVIQGAYSLLPRLIVSGANRSKMTMIDDVKM